jgi:precorrin-3B C17-methyltransferase
LSGRLFVIGLGPGDPRQLTGEAAAALAEAEAVYGYRPYLDRLAIEPGQSRHPFDNREEPARAEAALRRAETGAVVALVSGGDPGVFAMAATVCDVIDGGPDSWRAIDVIIVPGITAALAAAARVGAPLGDDFAVVSLSDNQRPWPLIEARLKSAAQAGFVLALYNPVSRARPWQLGAALAALGTVLRTETVVIFARAIGRAGEQLSATTLGRAGNEAADMATLVIVGSAATRAILRPGKHPLVYTARARGQAAT